LLNGLGSRLFGPHNRYYDFTRIDESAAKTWVGARATMSVLHCNKLPLASVCGLIATGIAVAIIAAVQAHQ